MEAEFHTPLHPFCGSVLEFLIVMYFIYIKDHYTAETDHLILEDETMRVRLVGQVGGTQLQPVLCSVNETAE